MPRTKYAKRIEEAEKLEDVSVDEGISESNNKIAPVQKVKKKFDPEDLISCRSVTVGGLCLSGVKSGDLYRWTEYGDITEVEYRDIATLVRSKSDYIFHPYLIIDDEDFIAEFPQLQQFYDANYTINDLEGVLSLSVGDMIATINTLPNGAKETLKNIASTQIAEGRLDSVKKIKALDDLFGTELNLFASLFE